MLYLSVLGLNDSITKELTLDIVYEFQCSLSS